MPIALREWTPKENMMCQYSEAQAISGLESAHLNHHLLKIIVIIIRFIQDYSKHLS